MECGSRAHSNGELGHLNDHIALCAIDHVVGAVHQYVHVHCPRRVCNGRVVHDSEEYINCTGSIPVAIFATNGLLKFGLLKTHFL